MPDRQAAAKPHLVLETYQCVVAVELVFDTPEAAIRLHGDLLKKARAGSVALDLEIKL